MFFVLHNYHDINVIFLVFVIENVGTKYLGPLSVESAKIYFSQFIPLNKGMITRVT